MFEVGAIVARLGGLLDPKGFQQAAAEYDKLDSKFKDPITAKFDIDDSDAQAKMTQLETMRQRWQEAKANAKFGIDVNQAKIALAEIEKQMLALGATSPFAQLTADTRALGQALGASGAGLRNLGREADNTERKLSAMGRTARIAAGAALGAGLGPAGMVAGGAAGGLLGGRGGGGGGGGGIPSWLWRRGGPLGLGGFSLATMLGLGPEHIIGAGLSVAGSAAGGAIGGGLVAGGALAREAVGAGTDMAVNQTAIANIQTLSKAYEQVDAAVTRYGAGSTQAKTAQANLNATMADMSSTVGPAATKALAGVSRQATAFGDSWQKATAGAQIQSTHLFSDILKTAQTYLKPIGDAAKTNIGAAVTNLQPLFNWFKGPGLVIFQDIEAQFTKGLPTSIGTFTQALELAAKILDKVSATGGTFTQHLDNFFTKWNSPAYQPKLNADINKLLGDFHLWSDVIKNLGIDLYTLFHAGAGEGNQLVQMLDNALIKFHDWETSVQGSTFLKTFFQNRGAELKAVLQVAGQLLGMFGNFYQAVQPLVPIVTSLIKETSGALKDIDKYFVRPVVDGVKWLTTHVASWVQGLGGVGTAMKDAIFLPFAAFLVAWKFDFIGKAKTFAGAMSSFWGGVKASVLGVRAAVVALMEGKGISGAWQAFKDLFNGTKLTAAEELGAAITGAFDKGAVTAEGAIVAGFERGAALMTGGGLAAGAAGGATSGLISGAEGVGGGAVAQKFMAGATTTESGIVLPSAVTRGGSLATSLPADAPGFLSRFGSLIGDAARTIAPLAVVGGLLAYLGRGASPVSPGHAGGGQGSLASLIPFQQTQTRSPFSSGAKGFHDSTNVGDVASFFNLFSSKAGKFQDVSNDPAALRKIADELKNVGSVSQLSRKQVDTLYVQLNKIKNSGDITAQQRAAVMELLRQLGPVHSQMHATADQFAQLKVNLVNWYKAPVQSLKSLQDDFNTVMRGIRSTVGLESSKGRALMRENLAGMVDDLTSSMLAGKVDAQKGMKALWGDIHKAQQSGSISWKDSWTGMFTYVTQARNNDKINQKQYMQDINSIINHGQDQIQAQVQNATNKRLATLQHEVATGQIRWQDYWKAVHTLNQHANVQAGQDMAGFLGNIVSGMEQSGNMTHDAMVHIGDQVNQALAQMGVKTRLNPPSAIAWAKYQVTGGTGATGNIGGGSSFGGMHAATGGRVPGGFGYEDNMMLMDPLGRPVAAMAGDEGIINRHQEPYVETAMTVAKQMGVIPYGSLDELWNGVRRPHAYASGGKLKPRKLAMGGYVNPLAHASVTPERIDEGVDYAGSGFYGAIGNGIVTDVMYGSGWFGKYGNTVVYQLTDGPQRGAYIFYAEGVTPRVKTGQRLKPGQAVASLIPGWHSGTEIGYALGPTGGEPLAGPYYSEGDRTAAGQAFSNFIASLGAPPGLAEGRSITGTFHGAVPSGGVAFAIPQLTPGKVKGTGPLAREVQGGVNKATTAANQFISKHAPTFTGAVGNLSGPAERQIYQAATRLGWNKIGAAGLIGNAMQESSLNASMSVPGNKGLFSWTPVNAQWNLVQLGNIGQQISLAAQAIGMSGIQAMNNAGSPAAAALWFEQNFEHAGIYGNRAQYASQAYASGYNRGGRLPGFNRGGRMSLAAGGVPRARPSRSYTTRHKSPIAATPKGSHRATGKTSAGAKLQSVLSFVGLPGLNAKNFADWDRQIADIDDRYQRQDTIFQMYDAPSGSLPTSDLNTLVGMREKEWDILEHEWDILPGAIKKVQHMISGIQGSYGGYWLYKHPHERGKPGPHDLGPGPIGDPLNQPHWKKGQKRVWVNQHDAWGADKLQKELNQNQRELKKLENEMYKMTHVQARQQHKISKNAMNAATSLANRMSKLLDQIQAAHQVTLNQTIAINNLIQRLQQELVSASGPAYAHIQQEIQKLQANRATNDKAAQLQKQLDALHKEAQKSAQKYAKEGFDYAWQAELQRWGVEDKLRRIGAIIQEIEKRLAKENEVLYGTSTKPKNVDRATGGAYGFLHVLQDRLHGSPDGSVQPITKTLADYGMDILDLAQQGAEVPPWRIKAIDNVLKQLGIEVPSTQGSGSAAQQGLAALQDFQRFQADRASALASFGSNFVAAGANPFSTALGQAAGFQYYGGAAGAASGGDVPTHNRGGRVSPYGYLPRGERVAAGGDMNVNITQHFQGAPDPHTYSAGLRHEIGALF